MKKTTALEKLRAQKLEEWKQAADYEEAESMDEIKNRMTEI